MNAVRGDSRKVGLDFRLFLGEQRPITAREMTGVESLSDWELEEC